MKRAVCDIDAIDSRIINALQEGFPLSTRPYRDAATQFGIKEDELIARLARLKKEGAVTRFGPFYNADAMGGAFCLCAMEVPKDRFDTVAGIVNALPQVAHNYERDHRLNMWFVLATEAPEGIEAAAETIEAETGICVFRFPKLKEFFIGFKVAA
ncbi:Lrp/AsnC family transcriptional regulator [Hoeflea sp. TYP-13]|uniref:Lrp/AsnC family transcriptional regulator n=1 Tax=Hoeflea sp. TYP-13 TaxID=3230023 RepID=UPI0034C6121C